MRNIEQKLVETLHKGACSPQISEIARETKEPAATIHYNVRKLEREGKVLAYNAVFDHAKIEMGVCSYVLINMDTDIAVQEKVAQEIAALPQVESVDIVTGTCTLLVKVHSKDLDSYFEFLKKSLSNRAIRKRTTLNCLKRVKSQFVKF